MSKKDLTDLGVKNATIHWNPGVAELYEAAVRLGEGHIVEGGPLLVHTQPHTGRSPKDRFIVEDDNTRDRVWWGGFNTPISAEVFAAQRTALRAARPLIAVNVHRPGAGPAHDAVHTGRVRIRLMTDDTSGVALWPDRAFEYPGALESGTEATDG